MFEESFTFYFLTNFLSLFTFVLFVFGLPALVFGKYSKTGDSAIGAIGRKVFSLLQSIHAFKDSYKDSNWSFGSAKFKWVITIVILGVTVSVFTAFFEVPLYIPFAWIFANTIEILESIGAM